MKLTLKTLIAAVALGVAALPAISSAQAEGKKGEGKGQRMTPEQQVTRLEEAVGSLSAEQKTKITAIYTKVSEQMQGLAQEDRQTKGAELRAAANKEVRAVLTADQQKKFDDMPAPGRGGGGKKKNN
ncbi:MAG: hypothetical protein EXS32_01815 [Opitutus sp.]|nr:hypothetical protein [Opitutus sp.]